MPKLAVNTEILPLSNRIVLRLKSWRRAAPGTTPQCVIGGQSLPAAVGERVPGPPDILCVAPSDWLLMTNPQGRAEEWRECVMSEALAQEVAVVEISDSLSGLIVSGPRAREVLAKGCGVDLHPLNLKVDQCVRTRLAQIPVVIVCLDTTPRYELWVVRSFREYLYRWLVDAAGDPPVPAS